MARAGKNFWEANFLDLTGQRFGRLTVIKEADKYISPQGLKFVQWLCKCDCGNDTIVLATNLKKGTTKSCGCYNIEQAKKRLFKDLTGQKFGRLTAIKPIENHTNSNGKSMMTKWLCRCDCGNECNVQSGNLLSGHTLSCGCYNKEQASKRSLINLVGQRFGRLTVLERVENEITSSGNSVVMWRCLCDCGEEIIVRSSALLHGYTKSCGCMKSHGEYYISTYLLSNSINFEKQKKFSDLLGVGGGNLSYDFYLPQYNLLIEYQGEQHFKPYKIFGGEEQFAIQQEHDRRKREYAKDNGYRLLEISYKDYNNIDNILTKAIN